MDFADITTALTGDAVVEIGGTVARRSFVYPPDVTNFVFDVDVSRVLFQAKSSIEDSSPVPRLAGGTNIRGFEPVLCGEASSLTALSTSAPRLAVLAWHGARDAQAVRAGTRWAFELLAKVSPRGEVSFVGPGAELLTRDWRVASRMPLARRYGTGSALLVAWVTENHSSRSASTGGPISAAFRAAINPVPSTTAAIRTVRRSLLVEIDPAARQPHVWLRVLTSAGAAFESDMAGTYNVGAVSTPPASAWTVQLIRADNVADPDPPVIESIDVPPSTWSPQFATLLRITPQFATGQTHDPTRVATTLTYTQMRQWLQARAVPGHPGPEP